MLKETFITLTVLGSLAAALPAQARDREYPHHETHHVQHHTPNHHYSHQPRVVFYLNDHNQYRQSFRHDGHHYRHNDRHHYRHSDRHHARHHGHHRRHYDRH